MLISAHYVNSSLYKLDATPIDRDIKHNRLASEIKRRRVNELEDIRDTIDDLEKLRPRHIYGKGGNGKISKQALKMLGEVEEICSRVLKS